MMMMTQPPTQNEDTTAPMVMDEIGLAAYRAVMGRAEKIVFSGSGPAQPPFDAEGIALVRAAIKRVERLVFHAVQQGEDSIAVAALRETLRVPMALETRP